MPHEAAMPLLAFLNRTGRDHRGRSIEEIWQYSDDELEHHHDYIQWLFPLKQRSGAMPDAPVLSDAEISAIGRDPAAQASIRQSLRRMLDFYGDNSRWLTWHDHNHLRISRIIASVRMLAGHDAAAAFHREILTIVRERGAAISPDNKRYWDAALQD
jgi:hypothetical protein